jgi:MoaA/NifB/PqqE/SkfB family radical SAM enzyme
MSEEKRLHIHTSSFCNSGCLFCSDARWANSKPPEALDKNAREDLKRMRDKVEKVVFSVGEPTLNKNIIEYLKLSKKYGYKEIALITNGRKLKDRDFCESLLAAGLNEINVSLHGSRKEIHDKLTRVPGSFDETFLGLCNLSFLKKKYSFNFYVNFLANKINYRDIQPFLKLILAFEGIQGIILNAVLPKGQAVKFFREIVPYYKDVGREMVKALKNLNIDKDKNNRNIHILGLPPCLLPGFEKNIIDYEYAITRGYEPKNDKKIIRLPWEEKIKGPLCRKCMLNNFCKGVWRSYVKKRGWNEFKPVLKK